VLWLFRQEPEVCTWQSTYHPLYYTLFGQQCKTPKRPLDETIEVLWETATYQYFVTTSFYHTPLAV